MAACCAPTRRYHANDHLGRAFDLRRADWRRNVFNGPNLVEHAKPRAGFLVLAALCRPVSPSKIYRPSTLSPFLIITTITLICRRCVLSQRVIRTVFFVPEGNARLLRSAGITNVTELNWGQRVEQGAVTVHCLPTQHWSKRSLTDTNKSLSGPPGR